jgi:hypothetical protein
MGSISQAVERVKHYMKMLEAAVDVVHYAYAKFAAITNEHNTQDAESEVVNTENAE